jgi:cyclic pyranopterin phosphate synthase
LEKSKQVSDSITATGERGAADEPRASSAETVASIGGGGVAQGGSAIPPLSHLDERGAARQVDISAKEPSIRIARAEALVELPPLAYAALKGQHLAKGDALAVARVAGIQAAKETSRLIPLCHQIPLSSASVDFSFDDAARTVRVETLAKTNARTGVEMEALTAASVAALTLYDMAKGVDKGIVIRHVRLLEKTGGKSGDWRA